MGSACSLNNKTDLNKGSKSNIFAVALKNHADIIISATIDTKSLRNSWACLTTGSDFGEFDRLYDLGIEVYDELFKTNPQILKFFPTLASVPTGVDLRTVASFRTQALRLVNVLVLGVKYCDRLDELNEKLRDIGRRHKKYLPNGLVKAEHFRAFEKAMATVVRRQVEKQEHQAQRISANALISMTSYIVNQVLIGYTSPT